MKSEESKLGSVAAKTASKSEGPGSSPEMDLRQRKKSNSPASESPKSKSRPKFVLPKKTIVKKQNAKVKNEHVLTTFRILVITLEDPYWVYFPTFKL